MADCRHPKGFYIGYRVGDAVGHFAGSKTPWSGHTIVIFERDPIYWRQHPDRLLDHTVELRMPIGVGHCPNGGLKRYPSVCKLVVAWGQVGLVTGHARIGLRQFLLVAALNGTPVVVPAAFSVVEREIAPRDTPSALRRKSVVDG
jgi:hypothetical protein